MTINVHKVTCFLQTKRETFLLQTLLEVVSYNLCRWLLSDESFKLPITL